MARLPEEISYTRYFRWCIEAGIPSYGAFIPRMTHLQSWRSTVISNEACKSAFGGAPTPPGTHQSTLSGVISLFRFAARFSILATHRGPTWRKKNIGMESRTVTGQRVTRLLGFRSRPTPENRRLAERPHRGNSVNNRWAHRRALSFADGHDPARPARLVKRRLSAPGGTFLTKSQHASCNVFALGFRSFSWRSSRIKSLAKRDACRTDWQACNSVLACDFARWRISEIQSLEALIPSKREKCVNSTAELSLLVIAFILCYHAAPSDRQVQIKRFY